jgi:hypothetical protein
MLCKTDKGVVTLHLDAFDFTDGLEFFLEVLWLALASDFGNIDLGKRFTIIFTGFHATIIVGAPSAST